jgi:nucleoside-diphosphate-sugar epimerase
MVLVTGGTGFIGAYIIKHLVSNKIRVRAIRRNTSKLPFFISPDILSQVEWVEGDVLDVISLEESMEGIDSVIHAAAKVSFDANEKDSMLHTNIEGTCNIVNIAIEKNIRRFIHISSVAALGRTADGETVDEEKLWTETRINTNYAISKHRAEMEVWRAIGEGLDAAILNPSTVLGYGDWSSSSCAIFKNVYDEFPYFTEGINGFVYVEDVARATLHLLQSGITRERFIINAENWSFHRLFDAIAENFHKKPPARNATPFLASIAWRMESIKSGLTGKRSLLSKETARIAQTKTYFSNNKILQYLPGFAFTPLEEAIRNSCAAYKNNLPLD